MVYVGPSRSMSTRDTQNRGLDAVAITVMRYRSSAAETCRSCFCQGCPVGTNTTSSSPNQACTSLAATRCPWWIGSKVPPMTPMRRRARRGRSPLPPSVTRHLVGQVLGSGVVTAAAEGEQAQHHDQQQGQHGGPHDPRVDPGGLGLGGGAEDTGGRHGAILPCGNRQADPCQPRQRDALENKQRGGDRSRRPDPAGDQ